MRSADRIRHREVRHGVRQGRIRRRFRNHLAADALRRGAQSQGAVLPGDNIDAAEAQRIGLVNRVVDGADLMTEVAAIASRIAHGPLTSYRYMKANVNLAASVDFRTLLDREAETHLRCGMTDDHREGASSALPAKSAKQVANWSLSGRLAG